MQDWARKATFAGEFGVTMQAVPIPGKAVEQRLFGPGLGADAEIRRAPGQGVRR